MKKLGVSKQLIFVLIFSIIYFIFSPGRSVALALPLLLFVFEFIDQIREKLIFPILLTVLFGFICWLYIKTALAIPEDSVNLCICASIFMHTALFGLTFNFKKVDNHADLYVPPIKTVFYFIGVYVVPIVIQYFIESIEGTVLNVVSKVFLVASIASVILPILVIRSIFARSSTAHYLYTEEEERAIIDNVSKQVAIENNVRVERINEYDRNFVITIKTGYPDYHINKKISDKLIKKLAAESIDVARVSIKF